MKIKKLKKSIIQLAHTGKEFPDTGKNGLISKRDSLHLTWDKDYKSGKRNWNIHKTHFRKFMVMDHVSYVIPGDDTKYDGRLSFWGEWEPSSDFKVQRHNNAEFIAHSPICDFNYIGERRHNTDPFIFGDYFWYTNCKQSNKLITKNLAPFSIVIFGTESSLDGTFLVDTIFVVGRRFSYEEITTKTSITTKELEFSNLNVLFSHKQNSKYSEYGYYQGLMHDNNHDYYSFVPAKLQDGEEITRHDRLKLDREKFNFAGMKKDNVTGKYRGSGAVCKLVCPNNRECKSEHSEAEIEKYWALIVDECRQQNFILGIKFPMPKGLSQ